MGKGSGTYDYYRLCISMGSTARTLVSLWGNIQGEWGRTCSEHCRIVRKPRNHSHRNRRTHREEVRRLRLPEMLYQRLIHHLYIARRVQRFDYKEVVNLEADAEPFSHGDRSRRDSHNALEF